MSTRAAVIFKNNYAAVAVYNHCGGYPSGLGNQLLKFIEKTKADAGRGYYGDRLDDPSYLAARWVFWKILRDKVGSGFGPADHYAIDNLNFGNIGILDPNCLPDDLEYVYTVVCNGIPDIAVRECYSTREWTNIEEAIAEF
jgi:hypothetical protein